MAKPTPPARNAPQEPEDQSVATFGTRSEAMSTSSQTRRRLRYLASCIAPYKHEFTIQIAANVVMTICALLIPFLFKHAIDRGIVRGDESQVLNFVVLALLASVVTWGAMVVNQIVGVFGIRVLNDLRVQLFTHIQRQGLDFFHSVRTGTVISRLTNDVDALENLVTDGVFMVFSNLLSLIGIEIFLFYLDPKLALATNVIFPVMIVGTIAFRYYSMRAYKLTREKMAMVTSFLAESLAGIRIVQAFGAEERMAREFDETNTAYRDVNMRTVQLSALYFPGVTLLSTIGTGIVLWYGGLLTAEGAVSIGVLFAFIAYLNDFFDPIQQLSQFYSSFLSAMAALDKIMVVMETEPTIVDPPDAIEAGKLEGRIEFDDVSFAYAPGAPEVLHNVSVAVHPGETVALVGHTGAGKSTFVKLLTRFHDPTHGTIRVDGTDIRSYVATSFRSQLGIVPQEGFLFSGTVADNIRFSRPEATDEEVVAAAEAIGAGKFIGELEFGYLTPVGERGSQLSAGQRQMIAFARALLADPAMLVLDEATSSVDVETELRLADGLQKLVAGRTAMIVAHRLSTIRNAHRILVMDRGIIVEAGTHDELLAAGGHYASLYGSWRGPSQTIEQSLAPID